jgi:hypothetical protein
MRDEWKDPLNSIEHVPKNPEDEETSKLAKSDVRRQKLRHLHRKEKCASLIIAIRRKGNPLHPRFALRFGNVFNAIERFDSRNGKKIRQAEVS